MKKVIVVLLSIVIVLLSIVAYASSLLRLGVVNPSVYSNVMPAMNAYDSMYESMMDYLLEPLESMDVPEEIEGVPEDVFTKAIPKKEFNKLVGKAIGGGMGWLLYNHEDVELPIQYFVDNLKTAIKTDERVVNSETNISATLNAIVNKRLAIYAPTGDYEHNFRGYVYYYLTGGRQEFMDNYDYWVDVAFYYYGVRLSAVTYISLAVLVILLVVLFLITKENRKSTFKLVKVLSIVYAVFNIIIALAMFSAPNLASLVDRLAPYAEYIQYAKSVTNALGVVAIGYALLLVIVAIVMAILQNKSEIEG